MQPHKHHPPLTDTADSFHPPTSPPNRGSSWELGWEGGSQKGSVGQEWAVRELFRCGQVDEEKVVGAVEVMQRESNELISQLVGELAEERRKSRQLKEQLASERRKMNSELRKCSEEVWRLTQQLQMSAGEGGRRQEEWEAVMEVMEGENRGLNAEMKGMRQLMSEYENQLQRLQQALKVKQHQVATSEGECRMLYDELVVKERDMEKQREYLINQHQQTIAIQEKQAQQMKKQLQKASEQMAEMAKDNQTVIEIAKQKEAAYSHMELQLLKVTGQLAQLEMDTKAVHKASQQHQAQQQQQWNLKFVQLQQTTTSALSHLQLSYTLKSTKLLALLNKALRRLPQHRTAFQPLLSLLAETASSCI